MIETAGEAPGGLGSTGAVGLPISCGSCSRTPGGSFLVAAAAASETESSKHVLNSFLIADFLPGSWCRQGCFHFLLGLPFPESSVGCLLLTFNQSLYHLSHLYPPISLSVFLTPLQYLRLINIHGAQASLFLCGSLKVILLEALLSVPLTAWELKVLICIHKITQEAQFARPATIKEGKKKQHLIEVLILFFVCEIKQQLYPYIWLGFKVLLEMWGTGGFVGHKFIFLYPGGNASKAICWDLAYTWSAVSMTSAVMGFWVTQWVQATRRAFPLMTPAATNKNKATFFFSPTLSITPDIIYIILFGPAPRSSTLLQFLLTAASEPKVSASN